MFGLPSLDWLVSKHRQIHFFGLGFIQIKITDVLRFHFYTGKLQSVVESIHTHRYDFTSYILKGELTQEIFQAVPPHCSDGGCEAEFYIDKVNCKPDTKPIEGQMRLHALKTCMMTLAAGSKYTINHNTFHRVRAESCITRVDLELHIQEYAEVLRPVKEKPVCPFSKPVPAQTLWEIVEDMLSV